MGMFDEIKCHYPLPRRFDESTPAVPLEIDPNQLTYQTKDTPLQFMDLYEIREDGTLWHEIYDTEDRSEYGRWKKEHPGEEPPEDFGIDKFGGCMTRINKEFTPVTDFTGEIDFYTTLGEIHTGWIEYSAYFIKGKMRDIPILKEFKPVNPEEEAKRKKEMEERFYKIENPLQLPQFPPAPPKQL